ncbi:anti-phage dCTP deaminase [Pararhizobium sp.]|uniref:anti-phage dCTP deaminase n=1 Tax=Pararhizobium sp. TaxID=1977563 RepID=UPI00272759D3|nr:anti-phage dCTP deaminase [Pararhizobium sp.]MDO9419008.1 anti-phage dCTP deaminase [Pararhizobium sp.]
MTIENPELFFCLVGPVGTDLDQVTSAISNQLQLFGYDSETVHLTTILPALTGIPEQEYPTLYDRYDSLISRSNALREDFDDDSLMAKLGFFLIQDIRDKRQADATKANRPVAYIIRQFKRSEEIALFRSVYGKQAFQISAYADPDLRLARLATKMRDADASRTRVSEFEHQAIKLLNRDEHEAALLHGQRIRDVFPLADVFIDASSSDTIKATLDRFIKIVFGYNFHSPSREEYGMYMAKSASLRSLDLSRQVGAAVFTKEGEVKTLGCNEVPSANGGTYWEGDKDDGREFHSHVDTNEDFKYRLLSDTLKNLSSVGVVDKKFAAMRSRDFLKHIYDKHGIDLDKSMMMMDIIEYGRIIHAEMNAITDAARKGISLQGTTLFCTTFPCHLCAKHIISSGIDRVVYIEPYPKSYASELYRDDIVLKRSEKRAQGKVYFEPFIGISPFRYRDFFEKTKRKDKSGKTVDWQSSEPLPIIKITGTEYIEVENAYLKVLVQMFAERRAMLPDSALTSTATRDVTRTTENPNALQKPKRKAPKNSTVDQK